MVKLKLNSSDLPYLKKIIRETEVEINNKDIRLMVQASLLEVSEKLHQKSFWLDKKISIGLTTVQAVAFKIHFMQVEIIDQPYYDTLLKTIVAKIDKTLTNGINYEPNN